jgi:hypothetical protein
MIQPDYIPRQEPAVSLHDLALRSLHLIDVENLLGGTSFSEADVAATADVYRAVAGVAIADLVIVSSSHHTALPAWFGWGKARRVVRSGPDGADLALIEIIKTENVAVRFDRIVIGSGDGIFASPAAHLQAAGVAVTVVSRPEFVSRQLRFAVRDVRYLHLMPDLGPALRKIA